MGILKGIAKGLGYFLLFPILVIAISLYAAVGLFVFLFQLGKLVFLFFTGRNLFGDLPEDVEVKRLKEINAPKQEDENDEETSLSNNIVYGSGYTSPYVNDEEPTVLEEPKPEEGGENDDQ